MRAEATTRRRNCLTKKKQRRFLMVVIAVSAENTLDGEVEFTKSNSHLEAVPTYTHDGARKSPG